MGVRITCTLQAEAEDHVRYSIEIHEPTSPGRGSATVARELGEVTFGGWSPDAPSDDLVTLARAFLRAAWSATRKADPEPWPRKIDRWRAR